MLVLSVDYNGAMTNNPARPASTIPVVRTCRNAAQSNLRNANYQILLMCFPLLHYLLVEHNQ